MAENLLPNTYTKLEEALKTANQIRRASVVVKQNSGDFKLFIINNKFTFQDELSSLTEVNKEETYININDSYGQVKRKNVIIVHEDLLFFAKILRKYNPKPNFFNQKFGDITLRLKKLLEEGFKKEEVEVNTSRNGSFNIQPLEIHYRFKKFIPTKIQINQILGEDSYEEYSLDLFIKSEETIKKLDYLLRMNEIEINELIQPIKQGKTIMLQFRLKEKVFERLKYKMFETKSFNELFDIKNPLNKRVISDLSFYDFNSYDIL